MAKKKEVKKKKNKYSRKPSSLKALGTAAVKGGKEVVKQYDHIKDLLKAQNKQSIVKGNKISSAHKSELVNKTLRDVADKKAIAAEKSIAGRNKTLASDPSQKAIIRNTKNVGKRAGKENQKAFNERAIKAQKSQDAQKMKDKNAITKAKILKDKTRRKDVAEGKNIPVIKKYVRKSEATQKAYNKNADKASGVPQGANERRMPIADVLTPKTNKNIKKDGLPPAIPKKGKITQVKGKKKVSIGTKAAAGAGLGAAAILANSKRKKDARNAEKAPETVKKAPQIPRKATNDSGRSAPTNKGVVPRSGSNAKPNKNKPEVKTPTVKVPSTSEIVDKAIGDKKMGSGRREQINKIAREHIAKKKKSNVPWEKILESLTMLLSSHIMSKGISKRYK